MLIAGLRNNLILAIALIHLGLDKTVIWDVYQPPRLFQLRISRNLYQMTLQRHWYDEVGWLLALAAIFPSQHSLFQSRSVNIESGHCLVIEYANIPEIVCRPC